MLSTSVCNCEVNICLKVMTVTVTVTLTKNNRISSCCNNSTSLWDQDLCMRRRRSHMNCNHWLTEATKHIWNIFRTQWFSLIIRLCWINLQYCKHLTRKQWISGPFSQSLQCLHMWQMPTLAVVLSILLYLDIGLSNSLLTRKTQALTNQLSSYTKAIYR